MIVGALRLPLTIAGMIDASTTASGSSSAPIRPEQFIFDRIRSDRDRQHIALQAQVGLFHDTLIKVAVLMQDIHGLIEEPEGVRTRYFMDCVRQR